MNASARQDTQPISTNPATPLTLASLAARVASTEIETPVDDVLELRENLSFMLTQIKGLQKNLDERLIEWIRANGTIEYGTKKIYVGTKKDTKCKALRPALEALMIACGGDWEKFCECMASGAIKYGAAKTVLGDEWGDHFETVEKSELKEVCEVDTKFLPQRSK